MHLLWYLLWEKISSIAYLGISHHQWVSLRPHTKSWCSLQYKNKVWYGQHFLCHYVTLLSYFFRVSSLAYPNLPGKKGYVVVVVSRRGLLPWRVATHKTDSCILEPYHPERVAMQFRLDQVIPYPPLTSLVTENAVGITYAHWQWLLCPVHEDLHLIPDDTRVGRPTLAWIRWFSMFMEPIIPILNNFGGSNVYNYINHGNRNHDYHAHPVSTSRNLFFMI